MPAATPGKDGVRLTLIARRLPLTTPYVLSFATIDALDTFFVVAEHQGRRGFGEATLLPGYGGEDAATARREFARAQALPAEAVAEAVRDSAPFLASAVACALETLADPSVWQAISTGLPLAAFCGGDAPAAAATNARRLAEDGYSVLKLKVGRDDVQADLARVRAVSAALRPGMTLRLDANQALSEGAATTLADGLQGLPVELLEQPFPPEAWEATARLVARTRVPVMLDESIWSEGDVDRAAAVGARLVKFKLCKHGGLGGTRSMIGRARSHGLGIVFGNGVQSALGNHLEARIHSELRIETAGEFNGFAKVVASERVDRITVAAGRMQCGRLDPDRVVGAAPEHASHAEAAQIVAH